MAEELAFIPQEGEVLEIPCLRKKQVGAMGPPCPVTLIGQLQGPLWLERLPRATLGPDSPHPA